MNKKSVLMCVLTLLLAGYIAFAVPLTRRMAEADTVTGLDIVMSDPDSRFISAADIAMECGFDPDTASRVKRHAFDLYAMEQRLNASDKIEFVNANLLTNGRVRLCVRPMEPVARVFDGNGSYYINATGKKISAEIRYHLDVPLVVGTFDSIYPPERLLPLLRYIGSHPEADALVATVVQQPGGNIMLVPRIVGHVVNFGDTSLVENKFARLRTFYRRVLPTVGWEHYDTIAVKWHNQIVATRRNKAVPSSNLTIVEEADNLEFEDFSTMEVPDTADIVFNHL